jgi:hypothetical protein
VNAKASSADYPAFRNFPNRTRVISSIPIDSDLHHLFRIPSRRRIRTALGASLKFCPPHLTAACDSKADFGKLSNDVFIGPKTLARSNGLFLDGLNQAWIIVAPARHIDAFRNRPHAQTIIWRRSQNLDASLSS